MIRIDLTAADIEAEDDRGRVVDFHALRHTLALRSSSGAGFISNPTRCRAALMLQRRKSRQKRRWQPSFGLKPRT